MNNLYIVLTTAYINAPRLGAVPPRTLLVGACVIHIDNGFGRIAADLKAHSSLVTDDPGATLKWLTQELTRDERRLLVWRAECIVVPSLIAAAKDLADLPSAAKFLQALVAALDRGLIDVAEPFGGARATSLDAILSKEGCPFRPMSKAAMSEAYRTTCHGDVREHLRLRALGLWRLWSRHQPGGADLERAVLDALDE